MQPFIQLALLVTLASASRSVNKLLIFQDSEASPTKLGPQEQTPRNASYQTSLVPRDALKQAWDTLGKDGMVPQGFDEQWDAIIGSIPVKEVAFFRPMRSRPGWLPPSSKALFTLDAPGFPSLAVYWSSNAGYIMPAIVTHNGPGRDVNFLAMLNEQGDSISARSLDAVQTIALSRVGDFASNGVPPAQQEPFRMISHGSRPHGARPHGTRPHGARPHGARAHEARPHAGPPRGAAPPELVHPETIAAKVKSVPGDTDIFRATAAAALRDGMPHNGIHRPWFTKKDKGISTSDGQQFRVRYNTEQRKVSMEQGWVIEHVFEPENVSTGAVSFESLGGGANVLPALSHHFGADRVATTFILSDRRFSLGWGQDGLELGVGHQMLIGDIDEQVFIAGEMEIQGSAVTVSFNFESGTFTKGIVGMYKHGQANEEFYNYWTSKLTPLLESLGASSVTRAENSLMPVKGAPVQKTVDGFCKGAKWLRSCVCVSQQQQWLEWCSQLEGLSVQCDPELCTPDV